MESVRLLFPAVMAPENSVLTAAQAQPELPAVTALEAVVSAVMAETALSEVLALMAGWASAEPVVQVPMASSIPMDTVTVRLKAAAVRREPMVRPAPEERAVMLWQQALSDTVLARRQVTVT